MSRIRIIATIVGGNFGGKNEITQEPVLALLVEEDRPAGEGRVHARRGVHRRPRRVIPFIMDYKTGVTKEGRILARKMRLVLDGGAYCSWSETTLGKACILSPGPYKIDNVLVEAFVVYTNKTMTGRDARLRRAAGVLRLRIADGRHRRGARHRSARNPPAQRLRRRLVEPDRAGAAQRGGQGIAAQGGRALRLEEPRS